MQLLVQEHEITDMNKQCTCKDSILIILHILWSTTSSLHNQFYWKSYKCLYFKAFIFSGFKGAKQILNGGPVCRLWPFHQNEGQAHYGCQGNRWQDQAWWGTAKGITGDSIQEAVTCGIKVIPCCDCNCHNVPYLFQ